MKRFVYAAQRSPKTANVYKVADELGYGKPLYMDPSPYGYICKWGRKFASLQLSDLVLEELCKYYGIDYRNIEDSDDPFMKIEYILADRAGLDFIDWLYSEDGEEYSSKKKELFKDQNLYEEANILAQEKVDEINEKLGLECFISRTGHLIVPYAHEV